MAEKSSKGKILVVLILAIIGIPAAFAGLQFYSMDAADKSIANAKVDFGITELLNIQDTLMDLLISRELEGEFDLVFEGKGFLDTQVKSIQAQVFLEDVFVGSFVSNEFFTIPGSGTESAHMDFKIDLSEISLSDVMQVVNSILEHNGEVKISIEALMEPVIIVFPMTVPVTDTDYYLSYSEAPQVSSLSWSSPSCEIREEATFSSTVTNVFRDSSVTGTLDVVVREDVSWGSDSTVEIFSYPIQLEAGESVTVSDDFTPYKEGSTNGFFLRAQWGSRIIEEQASSYPPRLQVIEGTLGVEEVYWTVSGVRTSVCEVDDLVQAHIKLGTSGFALDDEITVKIRKDLALLPDTNLVTKDFSVVLDRNQDTEIVVDFRPPEESGALTRGYFVEVDGDAQWTMPDEYPPRLTVGGGEPAQGSLSVTNAWWSWSGSTVTSADIGDNIDGKVTLRAVGGPVSGEVTVNIREDLAWASDETLTSDTFAVSLNEGEQRTFTVPFTALESSGSGFSGYFIDVQGDVSWTMSNSYPPRLTVNEPLELPEPTGYPVVQSAWWEVGGVPVTEASQGQSVTAVIRLMSVGGLSEGYVTVRIRGDYALLPDDDVIVNSYQITLDESEYGDIEITFSASEKSGFMFRGYFIQVDFDSWGDDWTMSSPYPPRLEVN